MNELHTAYITQHGSGADKSDWIVLNKDKEEIHRLPKHLDEKTAMGIIHFGRKFEVVAFNNGIKFQKNLLPQKIIDLEIIVKRQEAERAYLVKENEKIAN